MTRTMKVNSSARGKRGRDSSLPLFIFRDHRQRLRQRHIHTTNERVTMMHENDQLQRDSYPCS